MPASRTRSSSARSSAREGAMRDQIRRCPHGAAREHRDAVDLAGPARPGACPAAQLRSARKPTSGGSPRAIPSSSIDKLVQRGIAVGVRPPALDLGDPELALAAPPRRARTVRSGRPASAATTCSATDPARDARRSPAAPRSRSQLRAASEPDSQPSPAQRSRTGRHGPTGAGPGAKPGRAPEHHRPVPAQVAGVDDSGPPASAAARRRRASSGASARQAIDAARSRPPSRRGPTSDLVRVPHRRGLSTSSPLR